MEVILGRERIHLGDADLVGEGGEARVYRHRDLALKIFHPVDPALPRDLRRAAEKAKRLKLDKLAAFPLGLPSEVIVPTGLLRARGEVVGYAMRRVDGAHDVRRLGQRRWREHTISNAEVTALFERLHQTLLSLHARNVVVGDLNDCNVLFSADPTSGLQPWLIDADSMQLPTHACTVAQERFLDPRLFGVNLAERPCFSPETDWYAFATQLFSSLLYVHPYGGTHAHLPTLLRRAEARHSVLRSDVTYPKSGVHFRILPDDLLGWFEAVFDEDIRDVFPARLLRMRWTRCRCGVEHARPTCPECAQPHGSWRRETVVHHGRALARRILVTRGRVLAVAMQGGLRYLHEEDGKLIREDRTEIPAPRLGLGDRVALSGLTTWIGRGTTLLGFRGGQEIARHTTSCFGSEPAFDANGKGLFRFQDEWLLAGDGARLGKVLEGQTWFRVGEQLGFGFYRAGRCTFGFLLRVGCPGLRELKLPPLEGRLLESSCAFDPHHVLFTAVTEKDGVRTHLLCLFDDEGRLLGQREGASEDRCLRSIHGKALLGGRILTCTDDGLLSLQVDPATGRIEEGTLFADTQPFVSAESELLPGSGGTAIVVSPEEIIELSLLP